METYIVSTVKSIFVYFQSEYTIPDWQVNNAYDLNLLDTQSGTLVLSGGLPQVFDIATKTLRYLVPLNTFQFNRWYVIELRNKVTGNKFYSKIKYGEPQDRAFMVLDNIEPMPNTFTGIAMKVEGTGLDTINLEFIRAGQSVVYSAVLPDSLNGRYIVMAQNKSKQLLLPIVMKGDIYKYIMAENVQADTVGTTVLEAALTIVSE
jgi:hypothetical protein